MSLFERQAPELRVQRWIGEDGGISVAPLKLSDLGTGQRFCSPSSTGAAAAMRMGFQRSKDCMVH